MSVQKTEQTRLVRYLRQAAEIALSNAWTAQSPADKDMYRARAETHKQAAEMLSVAWNTAKETP